MKTSRIAKEIARKLRREQTDAEKLLWEKLRNRNFLDLKFTRQHPIYYFKDDMKKFFIADFFCNELKLIIELDGKIHENQEDYDEAREEILYTKKMVILRFRNEEIKENINTALIKIKRFINQQFPSLLSAGRQMRLWRKSEKGKACLAGSARQG